MSYTEPIVARGNKNDNNTFHAEELQVFTQPYPVCTWPEVMFGAETGWLTHTALFKRHCWKWKQIKKNLKKDFMICPIIYLYVLNLLLGVLIVLDQKQESLLTLPTSLMCNTRSALKCCKSEICLCYSPWAPDTETCWCELWFVYNPLLSFAVAFNKTSHTFKV